MKQNFISLIRGIVKIINCFLYWLESKNASAPTKNKFVDLAPTDEADKAGVYSEAILFATNNTKVYNIALTGPYGSGKSSIIRSFLRIYRRPALHISLAAFVPEINSDGGKMSRQEIERSILQQMLYGADADKLPLSRFKRIRSPGVWSILKSFFITLGVLALWYLSDKWMDIINGAFFSPFNLSDALRLGVGAFGLIFLWVTLHHFYVASFGLSLKSVSLRDLEIRPAHDDQTSILNRHLDEILYFFHSTKYDLVVIEDLDRFNDSEIFVTLREINSLVNEYAGVDRTVRFLYALRDDMFMNTDRTKFFEFIIPVIPIINTSNSIDMVLAQGRRLALDERLDRQFLREVSRYLNDLRLIQNIFNEYAIYVANLETDGESVLDANKLLAVLIYKNVYPRDFEQLHRGEGNLAEILNSQHELVRHGEAEYLAEIENLEKKLEVVERQTPADLRELRQIYAMALIEKLPQSTSTVGLDRSTTIPLNHVANFEGLEQLIKAQRVYCQFFNGNYNTIDVSKLQAEVDANKTYLQRKEEIEWKGSDNKNMMIKKINDLRSGIPELRMRRLNELLRLNAVNVDDLFKGFGENGELARFLILEGHLDDTYYQYTSLFHSGRLSPNDNRFLIRIRAFVTPEPNFPLDNPNEVIAAMRDEDFRQSYVLNVRLVDALLHDQSRNVAQVQKLLYFLSSEFEISEEFLIVYYASGLEVSKLLFGLANAWVHLVPAAIKSPNNISHVTQLLANLPQSSLTKLAQDFRELSSFIAQNLPEILSNMPKRAAENVGYFDFEVKEFAEIRDHSEIVNFMFDEGRYELTIANLEYIYRHILKQSDIQAFRLSNFTTILSLNSDKLMRKLNQDFDLYLREILLQLKENTKEDASAILAILNQDLLDPDAVRQFLKMQTIRLPTLEGVPEKLKSTVFELNVIKATWLNCLAFVESSEFESDSLIEFLEKEVVKETLLQLAMPDDTDLENIYEFLLNADGLSDAAYQAYVHAVPKPFQTMPNNLEQSKLGILIAEEKIRFTRENFNALGNGGDLQVVFAANNIEEFLNNYENFSLDGIFHEKLLQSNLDNLTKIRILELMDLEAFVTHPEQSALIGSIIVDGGVNKLKISGSAARSLITYSHPVETQISLFNRYHRLFSSEEVRQILISLPRPFSEIKTGYFTPRLKNKPENLDLVKWLDSREIISSWSEDRFFTDDIKVNLYRR